MDTPRYTPPAAPSVRLCPGCSTPLDALETLCLACIDREVMITQLIQQGLPLIAGGS